MSKMIHLARPYFDSEELVEIRKVLESGWVSQGPKTKEFEENVSKYLSAKNVVALTNCTCALHLSLLCLGIKKGDEVLVADYTYPATGHSVVYCGGKPVFVDVDPKTYNISPDEIRKKITKKTKAIIPVHTFGQPAEMDEILEIAEEHDLKVVEDGACAFGAKYKGKFAGTMGDVGCYSFHARKGITTGEGGMVVARDREIAEHIRKLSVFGIVTAWNRENTDEFVVPEFNEIGYNFKMSDITAAVGVAQLKKLDYIIKRKIEIARYWDEKLEKMSLINSPYNSPDGLHIYQSYVALVDKKINRNRLIELLRKEGIQAQIGTYASHVQPVYGSKDKCPNSLEIFNKAIALPMFYTLEEAEIDEMAIVLERTLEGM
ncbi:MAG: DegT/DnrJ/EryC1/StrS family aminotransferase [Euryarchaeota archaeon]|nr:DegT/DnrJ/EryC1/StrS family aminotransferase [Euryarchaeota archaeon]MBU4032160.1 DegT/DnrJ/EryC1/StrS family aminotransferase [Candidatus Thermoplasmatota archaeon]MBU4072296.1 DegT/DnrJ/EryC1/StrS family aminotransferase [Candidatus Thermoplasmatota archaeon]MBU4143856.1 DegT/DnrJ/EryC1/StrS family aminotransferase [Candidatus Thermoplasmatota archaeon]